MTQKTNLSRANCASFDLPAGGEVPVWVHLLPAAHGEVRTHDGRGPYKVTDPAAIIAASLQSDPRDQGGLIIDENHSSDLAAPKGGPSPSRGRITEMETRADGIWGKVAWTAAGQALMADRAYRGISPVITYDATGTVHSILRAGLVNYPNLRGMTALNSENPMDLTKLAKALGLADTATMDEMIAAIGDLKKGGKADATALQAAMTKVGELVGVPTGDAQAILAGVGLVVGGKETLVALQAQVAAQASQITALTDGNKRTASEAYIDGQIAQKRMGLSATNRESMIALHMSQPDTCKTLVEGLPLAGVSHTTLLPPNKDGVQVALNSEELAVAKATGKSPTEFAALMAADRTAKEAK
ncbi:phage protease [Cypionkella psychrotolerans]|uniref:phage protease n=1 Tax=Cypionkella psychrotolerans TaxID=1678131 RepID=UPI0006B64E2B|nr:phage protease [Cypionkella psychrotolerans]